MSELYGIPFDNIAEGAGLVADLSRHLVSHRAELRDVGAVEVGIVARGAGADVYLSAGAVTAIERWFDTPPAAIPVETVPDDVVWILKAGEKKFLGRGDVLAQIIPEPSEPLGTLRTSIGIVKMWRDSKGYGVIECADIAPWDIWSHFAALEMPGFKTLTIGEQVEVTYYRARQESYRYIAKRVRLFAHQK